jgi:hypothetical protein
MCVSAIYEALCNEDCVAGFHEIAQIETTNCCGDTTKICVRDGTDHFIQLCAPFTPCPTGKKLGLVTSPCSGCVDSTYFCIDSISAN